MSLTTFPLEVIEMIIGKMCFVDLPYFLQTSKVIQVDPAALHSDIQNIFAASSYHAKYQFIPKEARKHIHKNMREFPDMWIFWTVDDVLEKYTSPFCQNCGDFGYMFMWAAVPVRKMCAYCLVDEPEWSHYELTRAAKLLGLARGDIGFFPVLFDETQYTTYYAHYYSHPPPPRILGETLYSIAVSKGRDSAETRAAFHKLRGGGYVDGFMDGFVKVSGVFHSTVQSYGGAEIICGQCQPISPKDSSISNLDTFSRHIYKSRYPSKAVISRSVPRTYEALRHHMSIFHPDMLNSFDAGWQSLSPELKTKWVTHSPKDDSHCHLETWESWTVYAFSRMTLATSRPPRRETGILIQYLFNQIRYEGELFGIPEEIHVLGAESPRSEGDDEDDEDDEEEDEEDEEDRQARRTIDLKSRIAEYFTEYFLLRIREEGEKWVMDTVASGGVGALTPLLGADSVLDVIANSRVNEKRDGMEVGTVVEQALMEQI